MMFFIRLIIGGLLGMACGVGLFVASFRQPDDFGEFVWKGPIIFVLGAALAGYGV